MKMQEDENRRLNQALEDAVQGLQQVPTQEQLAHTLTVVRRAMQAGGQWIAAVETTPGAAQPVGACTLGHNADRHPRLVGQPPQQIGADSTGPQNRNRTNFHTYPLPCFYGLMMRISVLSSCSVQCHGFRMIP